MTKKLSSLSTLVLMFCAACGGDGGKAPATNEVISSEIRESEGADGEAGGRSARALGQALEGLVEQSAPWADLELRVQDARLLSGDKPADFPQGVRFSSSSVYASVELRVTSNGEGPTDYRERDTWDLLLADGTRVTPLNPVGVLVMPGESASTRLFYRVADDAELGGASIEINGADRRRQEPLLIPLDREHTFESEVRIDDLVGRFFQPEGAGDLTFEILDATYGVNLVGQGRRAPRDTRLVQLDVRVKTTGDYETPFRNRERGLLLEIDGDRVVPEERIAAPVGAWDVLDVRLTYPVEEGVSEVELVVDVGDYEVTRVPVSLPAAEASDSESGDEGGSSGADEGGSDDEGWSGDESGSDEEGWGDDEGWSEDEGGSDGDDWGGDDGGWSDDDGDDWSEEG